MQNEKENLNIGDKINDFVQKNRKSIFAVICAVVVLFAGMLIYYYISDSLNKTAISKVEDLNRRFIELYDDISEGLETHEIETLLADLFEFAQSHSGFPGSKAWSLIANIYSDRKDWPLAEEMWIKAAKVGEKTYLGPISLFQAAAVNEEQGNFERAIEFYQQCVDHKFEFPAVARAQFSIGRLNEQIGNYPEAIEAYRAILINWQGIPVWQHLARSRITAIETR